MCTSHSRICVAIAVATVAIIGSGLDAVTFVRQPNSRGPSAVLAGYECLAVVSRGFFNSSKVSRTRNMVIMHSKGMTAPAADIEVLFLAYMHRVVSMNNWKGLQLATISNGYSPRRLIRVDPNAVMLTDYYVLVVDDLLALQHNMQRFISVGRAYNPAARFVIMFSQPDAPIAGRVHVAQRVFEIMFNRFGAAKVVACVSAGHLRYDIFRTDPYRNMSDCGSLAPKLVGQCSEGRLLKPAQTQLALRANLVPSKMTGCTFHFCTRVSEPYVEEGCEEGLEVQLLKTLEHIMDFTRNTTCTTMERGDRDDHGNWTNLLSHVRDKTCDLLVGGFFPDNEVQEDFAVTTTYMQDTYTWYVFLAPLEEPWRGLIDIFEPITWLLFFAILLVAAIAWLALGWASLHEDVAHRRPVLASLNTWSVFLSVSANNRPSQTPLRVFFLMLALYGLNVTTIYTSNLITMFTDPKHETQLDSIEDILEAELPIGGREEYGDWFKNENPLDQIVDRRYNWSDRFLPKPKNLHRVIDGEQAMLMNRFYMLSSSLREEIFELPGNVFTNPLQMITSHGFPLLNDINMLVNRMKDTGLVHKINTDFIFAMDLQQAIRMAKRNLGKTSQVVLTVDHLQGAFAILIIGHMMNGLVFGLEMLTATEWYARMKRRLRRRLGDWWQRFCVALGMKKRRPVRKSRLLVYPVKRKWRQRIRAHWTKRWSIVQKKLRKPLKKSNVDASIADAVKMRPMRTRTYNNVNGMYTK